MVEKLKVVSRSDPASTPEGLGKHGQALWRQVQREYQVDDVGGVEILKQVCHAADMAARLREHVDEEGEIIKTKLGPREHPALKQELAYRGFVVRGLQKLGLNYEAVKAMGRPPGYA